MVRKSSITQSGGWLYEVLKMLLREKSLVDIQEMHFKVCCLKQQCFQNYLCFFVRAICIVKPTSFYSVV